MVHRVWKNSDSAERAETIRSGYQRRHICSCQCHRSDGASEEQYGLRDIELAVNGKHTPFEARIGALFIDLERHAQIAGDLLISFVREDLHIVEHGLPNSFVRPDVAVGSGARHQLRCGKCFQFSANDDRESGIFFSDHEVLFHSPRCVFGDFDLSYVVVGLTQSPAREHRFRVLRHAPIGSIQGVLLPALRLMQDFVNVGSGSNLVHLRYRQAMFLQVFQTSVL